MLVQNATPIAVSVLAFELAPAIAFGCASERIANSVARWPAILRLIAPAVCSLPYVLMAAWNHMFRWEWLALYTTLPIVIAWLLAAAAKVDPEQKGNWRDALVLLTLGVSVDLRWFDSAWPHGMRGLGNLLLVDAGLYAFLAIRRLTGAGFDFHLRWSDWKTGLRELIFFAPFVLILGLALGFLHPHSDFPAPAKAALTWAGIFVFVAVPEELFFRGWAQNLLERRLGRRGALLMTAILFGLSHFNKRSAHFNWRYVLLASIAGIFYGRAWREQRRIPASTITHTCVDWLWSFWF
jgi:membrane protease YdiL (CAAX protease family)